MAYIKSNGKGGYFFNKWNKMDDSWEEVRDDDARIDLVGHEDETYSDKRRESLAGGGYGTFSEQLEIMSEQGFDAWRDHCAEIKAKIPKE